MDRTILYILALILLVYIPSSTGTTEKNSNNNKSSQCLIELGKICIDVEDTVQGAALTVGIGLLTEIDPKLFHQAVDKVLQTYHQYPKNTATLGVLLSMAFLWDSINDHNKIDIYRRQIIYVLQEQNEDQRLEQLKIIRDLLIADRDRQLTMGFIKVISAIGFGYIAYGTIGSWLFYPMAGATTLSGAAALVNVYNYHQFSILKTKLKEDGYLQQ